MDFNFNFRFTNPLIVKIETAPPASELTQQYQNIMSKITEFATEVKASFTQINTAVSGLSADVTGLKKKIDELQANPGPISPEDQALLDEIQASAGSIATRLKALDDATVEAPTPPVDPVVSDD